MSIEIQPLTPPTITIKNSGSEVVDTLREKLDAIGNKIAAKVIAETMINAEQQAKEMLAKLSVLATPQHTCMHVKLGEMPVVKLKQNAHAELGRALSLLRAGLTPMLFGPAGCGKTFLAEQCAEALKLSFDHLCFSAGVSETWLFGRQLPQGFVEGGFSKAYRNGGVFLADEFDAADPNLLMAINTALANGHLHNPMTGENITRHKDFYFIAACNTLGKGSDAIYTARNRLDAATLDRFVILEIGYEKKVENALSPNHSDLLRKIRKMLNEKNSQEILSYRAFDKLEILTTVCNFSVKDAVSMLTASWPVELQKEAQSLISLGDTAKVPF